MISLTLSDFLVFQLVSTSPVWTWLKTLPTSSSTPSRTWGRWRWRLSRCCSAGRASSGRVARSPGSTSSAATLWKSVSSAHLWLTWTLNYSLLVLSARRRQNDPTRRNKLMKSVYFSFIPLKCVWWCKCWFLYHISSYLYVSFLSFVHYTKYYRIHFKYIHFLFLYLCFYTHSVALSTNFWIHFNTLYK